MRYLVAIAVIVGAALGPVAAPASASTARLVDVVLPPECRFPPPDGVCPPGSATVLVYEAGAGEANRVGVERGTQRVRVSDPGAVIEAGEGCESVDPRNVSCVAENGIALVFVDAGDRADTIRSGDIVHGGSGDDVLVGGPAGDQLFGGKGADILRGRGASDRLYDASPRDPFGSSDLSPFFPSVMESSPSDPALVPLADPGRGPDTFDGGTGRDTISYEGRAAGVRVDLANTAAVAGARREHDSVTDFETAIGGAGDDRLAGNNRRLNELDGGGGDDRILGRRGDDWIEGGRGRNVIVAGPGNDAVSRRYSPSDLGSERIFCGSGSDGVSYIFPSDFVNDDCEDLDLSFLSDGGLLWQSVVSHLPFDEDTPPIVLSAAELWCYVAVNPSGCRLTLEVRVQGPATRRGTAPPRGTLLGAQAYTFAADERKAITLELSPAGVRILRRHKALVVRVRASKDPPDQPGGYLTVLRAP